MNSVVNSPITIPVGSAVRRRPILPSNLFATLVFVVTEIMFFMALISAFLIIKANYPGWAPPQGIILPVGGTALNTGILILSGVLLFLCGRAAAAGRPVKTVEGLLLGSMVTGMIFVGVQGVEWINLIRYGMTMQSSIFGACFFLLIGTHGLHALAAVIAMIYVHKILRSGELRPDHVYSMQAFWFFVVGIWPVLYGLVYF